MAGIGLPPQISPGVLGDAMEGSNESGIDPVNDFTISVQILDDEGGSFDFALDLDNDGLFGEPGEPKLIDQTLVAGVGMTWTTGMGIPAPNGIDWDDLSSLSFNPDTHPSGLNREIHVQAVEHVVSMPDAVVNDDFTNLPLQNSMPFFDAGSIDVDQGGGCSGGNSHVVVDATFTEYGIGDTVTVRINWGDTHIETFTNVLGRVSNDDRQVGFPFPLVHDYEIAGDYDITLEVWDDEGTQFNVDEVYGSKVVYGDLETIVLGGPSGPSVCLNDDGVLTVNGSAGNDTVTITQPNSHIHVESSFFDPQDFAWAAVNSIVVQLGNGNDELMVNANKPLAAVGGAGDDQLNGGPARSILIGSAGADKLKGGSAEDILVAGATDHDDDAEALLWLLAEWNSTHSFMDRVNNLIDGTGSVCGLNETPDESYFLSSADDIAIDILIGLGSTDWILRNIGDRNQGPFDFVT